MLELAVGGGIRCLPPYVQSEDAFLLHPPLALPTLRRLIPDPALEVDHLCKLIAIVAGADDDGRHVCFVLVAGCFLLNFDGTAHNNVVAVQVVTLVEQCLALWHLQVQLRDAEQLRSDMV